MGNVKDVQIYQLPATNLSIVDFSNLVITPTSRCLPSPTNGAAETFSEVTWTETHIYWVEILKLSCVDANVLNSKLVIFFDEVIAQTRKSLLTAVKALPCGNELICLNHLKRRQETVLNSAYGFQNPNVFGLRLVSPRHGLALQEGQELPALQVRRGIGPLFVAFKPFHYRFEIRIAKSLTTDHHLFGNRQFRLHLPTG